MALPRILSIAGSDSGGGAGIQADIKAITLLGGHAMTAVTALTAQDTTGVHRVELASPDMVAGQIEACVHDIGVDAVKIGMLGSPEIAAVVADRLHGIGVPVVFDPVMVSTSGSALADGATILAFERLMRLATLTTPNLPELAALGGLDAVAPKTGAVLVKGGHGTGDEIEDVLHAGGERFAFYSPRVRTVHTHGTGCTLASAIATGLGAGLPLDLAVERGIAFVQAAIAHAPGLGRGNGPLGPAQGRVPFYDALAAMDARGWRASDYAAKWPG
ncbi:MAG: bifunctional hydroxymethylpyrimidine kinase/phosphomethylpyrimidine kinase [Sphingomonadales bacterium]|nr:bifunctional hydroxymethylpyrimidine kinase/phosphomethylpyrimidine kinase [Sphingomonadales bacterium]MDE2569519.1 bifunctional hydroxymethylpyrimidine kinase/phosphomethylpyrimidine kinase [Sphingomonadales bacterium]